MSVALASRHGVDPKHGLYKLSFRAFFSGVRVWYPEVPRLLEAALGQAPGYWDLSVYKECEQLVCAIYGRKGAKDPRRLVPVDPAAGGDVDVLRYVVQHTEPGWPMMRMPPQAPPETPAWGRAGSAAPAAVPEPSATRLQRDEFDGLQWDEPFVEALLGCLSVEAASHRATWIAVGLVLRRLGLPFELWHGFSRRAPAGSKYKGAADCAKTWGSLDVETPRKKEDVVSLGTLCWLARRDGSAGYEAAWDALRARHGIVDATYARQNARWARKYAVVTEEEEEAAPCSPRGSAASAGRPASRASSVLSAEDGKELARALRMGLEYDWDFTPVTEGGKITPRNCPMCLVRA